MQQPLQRASSPGPWLCTWRRLKSACLLKIGARLSSTMADVHSIPLKNVVCERICRSGMRMLATVAASMPVANIPIIPNIQRTLSTPNILRMVIVAGEERLRMDDTNLRAMTMLATAQARMSMPVSGLRTLIARAGDQLRMEDASSRLRFHDHRAAATMLIGQLRLEPQEA